MSYEYGLPKRRWDADPRFPGESYRVPTFAHRSLIEFGTTPWLRATNAEYLLRVFFEMRANNGHGKGIDRLTYHDFSLAEIGDVFRKVATALRRGTYRPSGVRCCSIPKTGGGNRVLRLQTIVDRVIAGAIHREILGPLEAVSCPTSFGNRPGLSRLDKLARLQAEILSDKPFVLEDDILKAFDYVRFADVRPLLPRIVAEPKLRALIEMIFTHNHEQVGIAQGNPLSPDMLNLLLTAHLDRPFHTAGQGNPLLLRYVDNLASAVRSASEGSAVRQRVAQLLRPIGLELKSTGQLVDLRRQGAGLKLLGFLVQMDSERRIRFSILPQSWVKLRESLTEAHSSPHPRRQAGPSILSWLGAQVPAFVNVESSFPILERIRQLTVRTGLGETGISDGEWEQAVLTGIRQWSRYTSVAPGESGDRDGLCPYGSVALRDNTVPPTGAASIAVARA
ncbi:MAG: hypothetical protein K8U03_11745 [Planctomycetia bacterium]|nr:hypothetical protein [Planctomycetia bacterium]